MPIEPLDDDTLRQAVELEQKHHSNAAAAARELGITRSAFQNRVRQAARRGLCGTAPVIPGFAIQKITTVTNEDGVTVREFVQQKPDAAQEPFELPPSHEIKGISALVQDGRVIQQWIKTRALQADITAALREEFAARKPAPLLKAPKSTDADLMSVYPIADQHHGLLAWGKETGGEDYDLAIGTRRLRDCATRLIAQSPPSQTAIILNLGDWQHTDDQTNSTPASRHGLDADSRYTKILRTGVALMCDVIELALQRHQSVIVRNLPGNHDPHASIALTVALGAYYRNNPRVTIDDDPGAFFFHRFGSTLIGATHGHKLKPDRMAMTMAVERREDWGETQFHYFYFGHIHRETAREIGDVRVESFQSLAAKDAYSASHGYNSGQSLTSITIHRMEGEIGRHRVNIARQARVI